jgi:hypothetical protein
MFVGRGPETRSYVPLVAELFTAGRGYLDEAPNDPGYCDAAKLTGMDMDGKNFEDLRPLLEQTTASGSCSPAMTWDPQACRPRGSRCWKP